MEMTIVQWATIISPIIAVFLAWWTVRSSSKDTDKKIAAIKEWSEKEINQLKKLSQLEVETLSLKLDMELIQRTIIAQQANEERNSMQQIMSSNQITFQDLGLRKFESEQPARNLKYTTAYIQELKRLSAKLDDIKKNL